MTFWKPKSTWTPVAIARCLRVREDQVRATLRVTETHHSIAAWELDMLRRQVTFARLEARGFLTNPLVNAEERETFGRVIRDLDRIGCLLAEKNILRDARRLEEAQILGEQVRLAYSFLAQRLATREVAPSTPKAMPFRLKRMPAKAI